MTWRELLEASVPVHARRAAPDALRALAERLPGTPDRSRADGLAELLLVLESDAEALGAAVRDRARRLRAAPAGAPRRAVVERILVELGGDRKDRAALGRWFDGEAIADRDRLSQHRSWQQRQLLAQALTARLLDSEPLGSVAEGLANRLAAWVRDPDRPQLLRASYVALLGAVSDRVQDSGAAQAVRELAMGSGQVWIQVEAIKAYLALRPSTCRPILAAVLLPDDEALPHLPDDHMFVRARAAALAGEIGEVQLLLAALSRPDPSEHVRQACIRALVAANPVRARQWLVESQDDSDRVRALGWVVQLPDGAQAGAAGWVQALAIPLAEESPWVRALLVRALWDRRPELRDLPVGTESWDGALVDLAAGADEDVAEVAALLARWLDVQRTPKCRTALFQLEIWLQRAREGDRHTFTAPLSVLPVPKVLDVLSVAAADRFDLSAEPVRGGLRVQCGTRRSWALWRILHELRTPAPDKRQAHDHLVDEAHVGKLLAPSRRLAEVTPTRVPGQRVATTETLGWGSQLPLVAQLVGATARETTELMTPRGRITLHRTVPRWRAWWRIQRRYVALDGLRRTQLSRGADGIVAYDEAVADAGLRMVRDHQSAGWPQLVGLVAEAIRTDSNTLADLALVAGVMLGGWAVQSLAVNRAIRRQRQVIPLVVGGWGSRGKSGTERLKAGLFHGLGYRVVAKTTGCEAMVIASCPGADPVEVFLFRPFDKATIVEQRDVLELAASLQAQVMTWECMALRPGFVDVLQRQWMRDDLSTVTNTYPDHEDLQGPSGRDVAQTIAGFLPQGAVAFSTEQHMHPVLEQEARRVGTRLRALRPEHWRLLPRDLLRRFPYQAHPRNVALVVAMADHLGVPSDLALHRMADCVVPDLGVLKEYGPADYRGRSVSFVNGCSANERAGFLSNWGRMGLGEVGPDTGLTERLTIVFNNRADRLARQKVFAAIAVHDATADAMVLIGTNVGSFAADYAQGLRTELGPALIALGGSGRASAWDDLLQRVEQLLRRPRMTPEEAVERAVAHVGSANRELLREATSGQLVALRPADGEVGMVAAAGQWVREVSWLHDQHHDPPRPVDTVVSDLLELLAARLVPLPDSRVSGDQVVHQVVGTAPMGSRLRVLGAENIKGTGLDFVYRWISLDRTQALIDTAVAADQAPPARAALAALGAHTDWGLLDLELALGALQAVHDEGRWRLLGVQSEAEALLAELRSERDAHAAALGPGQGGSSGGWLDRVLTGLEAWLDPFDSVRRRRRAFRLYQDLGARRVGTHRAAEVAKKLTSRQKGGWLGKKG